jgi:hypothetical protein
MNRYEMVKLLAFFLLQELNQNPIISNFSRRKILETSIFLGLFPERRFHLLLGCLHFVNEDYS